MTAAPAAPAPVAAPRSRRGLVGLLTAAGISIFGTRMSFLAVPWFVLVTSGSAGRTGVVAFAEMTPYVLVQGLGGPLVDRLGAWRVSVSTDLVAALVVGAVPLLYAVDRLGFATLCGLVAVAGATRAAGDNGRNVMVPGVTEAARLPMERGAGSYDGVNRLAGLLGGPAAGVLVAVWSAPAVLAVDAATFALSALVVALLVPRAAAPTPAPVPDGDPADGYLHQLRGGFAYLRGDRLLLGIGAMVFVTNLIDQANGSVLMPSWVKEVTGSAVTLGLLSGVFGVGAVLGNVVLTWLGPRLPRRRTYAWCFVLCGSPRMFVMAALSVVSPVAAVAFLSGLGAGGINPILGAVEYERVPRHLQARVLGAVAALAWAGIPLGSLLGGFAVEHAGLRPTLLVAGVLYALTTAAPFVFPAWRGMDRDAAPAAISDDRAPVSR